MYIHRNGREFVGWDNFHCYKLKCSVKKHTLGVLGDLSCYCHQNASTVKVGDFPGGLSSQYISSVVLN